MMMPNPKQMEMAMRKMGIRSTQVEANRVIIEKADGTTIVVEEPTVTEIDMQGNKSFQVAGRVSEGTPARPKIPDEDVQLIVEKTGCNIEQAENALKECGGDIAAAIEKLGG